MGRLQRAVGYFLVACFLWIGSVTVAAAGNGTAAKYYSDNSALGRYYAQFAAQYSNQYKSNDDTMHAFLQLLRDSDLLAVELIESGIPANRLYPALNTLLQSDWKATDKVAMREAFHAIDYVLESVEYGFTRNHRSEFIREVIAQVPPMSFNG